MFSLSSRSSLVFARRGGENLRRTRRHLTGNSRGHLAAVRLNQLSTASARVGKQNDEMAACLEYRMAAMYPSAPRSGPKCVRLSFVAGEICSRPRALALLAKTTRDMFINKTFEQCASSPGGRDDRSEGRPMEAHAGAPHGARRLWVGHCSIRTARALRLATSPRIQTGEM